jgi:prevent-host-death family protein
MSMTRVMSISELKRDFYRLTEVVARGDTIIVTKHGKMKAKLEPLTEAERHVRRKAQPSFRNPARPKRIKR